MRRAWISLAAILVVVLIAVVGALAARKEKRADLIWTRPDYAGLGVDRIALIPPSTYDHNLQTANLVEAAVGSVLKSTGYRWISGNTTRDLLRARPGGDSLLRVLDAAILRVPRVDSLHAPGVCAVLRCDALLSVRVDQWEQLTPEANQAGKPSTTVQLKLALVDSLGRLLWTAAGAHTAEGQYYDPNTNPMGVKDSGLERKAVTSQGGAPSYREVATLLVTRMASAFPAKVSPAGTPAADSTVRADSAAGAPLR